MASGWAAAVAREEKRDLFWDEVRAIWGKEGLSKDSGLAISRTAPRPRITVSPVFAPILTDRQKNIVKRRMRVRGSAVWGRMLQILNDADMTMEEFVSNLTPEELVRGQIKDKNGNFTGSPPAWVPRAFHRACIAELMQRGRHLWQENYLTAIEVMTDIAAGRGDAGQVATPAERLKAAQMVIERIEGKVPDKLIVDTDRKWQIVIDDIVAEVPDSAIQRAQQSLNGAREAVAVLEGEVEDVEDAVIVEDEEPAEPVRARRTMKKPIASTSARKRQRRQ